MFKRGAEFNGGVVIGVSGQEGAPITFAAYGMGELPRFSNPEYAANFGRVFDVTGSYIVFQKLLFHTAPPVTKENGWRNSSVRSF